MSESIIIYIMTTSQAFVIAAEFGKLAWLKLNGAGRYPMSMEASTKLV
jgi:hypothetical protein